MAAIIDFFSLLAGAGMIFKFRTFPSIMLGASICLVLYASITLAVTVRSGEGQGLIAGLLLLPVIIVVSYGSFMIGIDLVVDDTGISRFFGGKKIQSLKWSEIKSFRDSTMAIPNRGSRRIFQVCPIKPRWINLSPGGKITFSSQMYNFGTFVKLVNEYIKTHHIEIERIRNGERMICSEISIT